jgi:Mg2+/Co2+ transporter CorB
MENVSLSTLFILLVALIGLSAFFSSAETCMMALNRYKVRHLAKEKKNRTANRVLKLLSNTDRLLGVVLIGNTIANIFAASIATIIGARLLGDKGIIIATGTLTFIILIFAEIGPKTIAARFSQPFAFAVSMPLLWVQRLIYPIVWLCNGFVQLLLVPFNLHKHNSKHDDLSTEELKTIVTESSDSLADKNPEMLVNILELENVSVEDIMIPKHEVVGLDLKNPWETIVNQLKNCEYTRLPVYEGHLEYVRGFIHMRDVARLLTNDELTKKTLLSILREPYFVPETVSLHRQLINFQKTKNRMALVINEYGDIQGLLTLEDLLGEIIGEFTTDGIDALKESIYAQEDGSYIIDGTLSIRDLNHELTWELPKNDAKTLSGLIIEMMQTIPNIDTCIRINDYLIEILKMENNRVKSAKVWKRI